jgi:hypothetical protein
MRGMRRVRVLIAAARHGRHPPTRSCTSHRLADHGRTPIRAAVCAVSPDSAPRPCNTGWVERRRDPYSGSRRADPIVASAIGSSNLYAVRVSQTPGVCAPVRASRLRVRSTLGRGGRTGVGRRCSRAVSRHEGPNPLITALSTRPGPRNPLPRALDPPAMTPRRAPAPHSVEWSPYRTS